MKAIILFISIFYSTHATCPKLLQMKDATVVIRYMDGINKYSVWKYAPAGYFVHSATFYGFKEPPEQAAMALYPDSCSAIADVNKWITDNKK